MGIFERIFFWARSKELGRYCELAGRFNEIRIGFFKDNIFFRVIRCLDFLDTIIC